eukprot:CAMPEP_0185582500 /NCGR_PEP_ID=MMETSP0434-20130131/20835_1 /TAXON_ID=626734 ORGANISM="Favella taraikaensis, Strain Fe Narragansett Bay" /NCGR_SAMPLE_ID=MMETSP0434 /ASSEMBLY_ACC=CAM_ASM_000379 /LENGTH=130 /DNA_ID=CAMNT_0028201329 /DNA_START=232 /DNA_END=626 /DNA_ORIENTATION=+
MTHPAQMAAFVRSVAALLALSTMRQSVAQASNTPSHHDARPYARGWRASLRRSQQTCDLDQDYMYTGQQTTLDLNASHTVAEIHTFVMSVAPTAGSYQLMSGYPPQPLADPGMTIRKAGLEMANVTMRLM